MNQLARGAGFVLKCDKLLCGQLAKNLHGYPLSEKPISATIYVAAGAAPELTQRLVPFDRKRGRIELKFHLVARLRAKRV